jgi:hypothetical protein
MCLKTACKKNTKKCCLLELLVQSRHVIVPLRLETVYPNWGESMILGELPYFEMSSISTDEFVRLVQILKNHTLNWLFSCHWGSQSCCFACTISKCNDEGRFLVEDLHQHIVLPHHPNLRYT